MSFHLSPCPNPNSRAVKVLNCTTGNPPIWSGQNPPPQSGWDWNCLSVDGVYTPGSGWDPMSGQTPQIGQCFSFQGQCYIIIDVGPSFPGGMGGQPGQALYSTWNNGATNFVCGNECDQSLTAFSSLQYPQYGCNYQATQFQGQPCPQIESCAPGFSWSTITCTCIPNSSTPQPKKLQIRDFTMDYSDLPTNQTTRNFTIRGDRGANFTLWVTNNNNYNYNFTSLAFENDANEKLYNIEINESGTHRGSITFPTVASDSQYTIYLLANANNNTELGGSFGGGNLVKLGNPSVTTTISQYVNTTVTLSLLHSSGTVTEPSNITISTPRNTTRSNDEFTTATIDWTVTTSSAFTLLRQPLATDFEVTTTQIHTGIDTVGATFVMDSVTNLTVGMGVSGSGIAGSPTISQINPPTDEEVAKAYPLTKDESDDDIKTIVLTTPSGNHSISQSTVLTFTGTGTDAAEDIYNTSFDIVNYTTNVNNFSCTLTDMTPQLTAAVSSSATVPVDSVAGLKVDTTQTVDGTTTKSATVVLDSVTGCWVGQTLMSDTEGETSGTPTITAINSTTKTITLSKIQSFSDENTLKFANSIASGIGLNDSTSSPFIDGISSLNLTLNAAQTIEDDQVLTFTGSSNTATIYGTIRLYTVGSSDFTMTLNLDNFLIVA